jgi:hypothetical protein
LNFRRRPESHLQLQVSEKFGIQKAAATARFSSGSIGGIVEAHDSHCLHGSTVIGT